MLSHTVPLEVDVRSAACCLGADYRAAGGSNKDRLAFISFLEYIAMSDVDEEIVKCLMLIELEHIAVNTSSFSPWINSSLYKLLKKALQIDSRKGMSKVERLIALGEGYVHFQNFDWNNLPYEHQWLNKETLLKRIEVLLKPALENLAEQSQYLLHQGPTYEKLVESLTEMSQRYHEKCKRRFFANAKREAQVLFIDFISRSSDKQYAFENDIEHSHVSQRFSYWVRLGALIEIALEIVAEYNYSPNGKSDMYDLCLEALNVRHFKDVDINLKIKSLLAVLMHLQSLISHVHQLPQKQREYLFKKIDTISHNIERLAHEQKNAAEDKSRLVRATNFVAKRGVRLAFEEMTTWVTLPAMCGIVVAGMGATAGFLIGGPPGAFIGGSMGPIIGKPILQALLTNVVGRVGLALLSSTQAVCKKLTFNTNQDLAELMKFCEELDGDDAALAEERALINTLLKLPEHLFTSEQKEQIQNTALSEDTFMEIKPY